MSQAERKASNTEMTQPEFITIKEKHVGKKVIRAFGRRWRLASRILPDEVGTHIYRTESGGIEFRSDREEAAYPCISEACSSLNMTLFVDPSDGTCALCGMLPEEGTPWFETIDELEEFVEDNIDTLIEEISVM
jgi:hypothetical protein